MDVDKNADVAVDYQVISVPTMMFFKGGEAVDTVIGAVPKSELEKKIAGLA